MIRTLIMISLLTLGLNQGLWAAYITDRLLVGIYPDAKRASQPTKIISSGTYISIIERQGSTIKVKLRDGTIGWIERRYITEEIPALAAVNDAKAKVKRLEGELKKSQKEIAQLKKNNTDSAKSQEFEGQLEKSRQEITQLKKELATGADKLKVKEKEIATLVTKLEEAARKQSQLPPADLPSTNNASTHDAKRYEAQIEKLESQLLQSQVKLARRIKMKEDDIHKEIDGLRERMIKAIEVLDLAPDAPAAIKPPEPPPPPPPPAETSQELPIWVYFMMLITLIAGIIAGFALFDLRTRSQRSYRL